MEHLLQLLGYFAPLSPELLLHLRILLKPIRFTKGDVILPIGEVATHIFFIETGLVRSYYVVDGKEVSNWFMKEGDIFISVLSFFRQLPSLDNHVALENCVCWGITYEELQETYALFPEFNVHGRLIANEYYCRSEERHLALKRQTPEHKYELMMEKDPQLLLRVSNKDMASYLDVSVRTYGDIRKAYAERNKKRKK